jgi:hypothetical protein
VNSELILSTFDDTEWDVPRTAAGLTKVNKACNDVVLQIKPLTKLPITPLEITLARVRVELDCLQERKSRVNLIVAEKDSPTPQPRLSVRVADPAQARCGSKQQVDTIDPAQVKKTQAQGKIQPKELNVVNQFEETPGTLLNERRLSIEPDRSLKQEQTKVKLKEPAVIDRYGRTRAAYKKIREETQRETAQKNSCKRKSDGV